MIKTHRPRGFAWNCASVFQQSPEIRNIDHDECILSGDLGVEDDVSATVRAAKRRRIATLADDFMNGAALHIHSARLDPQASFTAISHSFEKPQHARIALETCIQGKLPPCDELWEDTLDDDEILHRYVATHCTKVDEVIISAVEAQASCAPKRRLRSARVTSGPSEEALRKAAELRNRRTKVEAPKAGVDLQPYSCPRPTIPETQSPSSYMSTQETASDCGPSPTPAWTSSKWIKTGAFQLRHKSVDEECSRDELGATSLLTPSQRSRSRPRTSARARPAKAENRSSFSTTIAGTASTTTGLDASFDTTSVHDRQDHVESLPVQSKFEHRPGATAQETCPKASYHTAPEHGEDTVLNETNDGPNAATDVHEAGQTDVSKPNKARKTKSTGSQLAAARQHSSARRQSAPSGSHNPDNASENFSSPPGRRPRSFRTQYSKVAAAGDSPFVFRKKSWGRVQSQNLNTDPAMQAQVQVSKETARRTYENPSTRPAGSEVRRKDDAGGDHVVCRSPNTPLVNQHLNHILPKANESSQKSTSVREALRKELEASGAELSRAPGTATSSQPEADGPIATQQHDFCRSNSESRTAEQLEDVDHIDGEDESNVPANPAAESQAWPGTQAALALAQRNLFTSPEKADTTLYPGDKTTSPSQPEREPLKRLSQERAAIPLPSTQALLDGWQGWSSIKKPRSSSIRRKSIAQSPTLHKGIVTSDPPEHLATNHSRSSLRLSTSDLDANRRRSSLRFSMSCTDSPPQDTKSDPASHTPREDMPPPSFKSVSGGAASVSLPQSGRAPFSATETSEDDDRDWSTCQQAQAPEDYDSQDLGITITELAEEVLGSARTGFESQTF